MELVGSWRAADGVTFERLDDDVLAIHLVSGLYYSMNGTAADCWQAVIDGIEAGVIVAGFETIAENPAAVGPEVMAFVAELVEEQLVTPAAVRSATTDWQPAGRYSAPVLERFGDLQDLLLIDPIHDVDSQGWPSKSTG